MPVDFARSFSPEAMAGRRALGRADASIVQDRTPADRTIPQFTVQVRPDGLATPPWIGESITAVASIAKAAPFFPTLESVGLQLQRRISFPDHHSYSDSD